MVSKKLVFCALLGVGVIFLSVISFMNFSSKDQIDIGIFGKRFKRSVDALFREEIATIDTSDLFLDVFITDEFTHYGGLEEFFMRQEEATNTEVRGEQEENFEKIVQNTGFASPVRRSKMRSTRFERSTPTFDPKMTEFMKKVKEFLEANDKSESNNFEAELTELLEQHLNFTSRAEDGNTVTDNWAQIMLKLLRKAKQKENKNRRKNNGAKEKEAAQSSLKKVPGKFDPACKNPPTILANDTQAVVRSKQGQRIQCYMNLEVDPCEDFYEYACGNWEQYFPIPKDRSGYDTFEILREELDTKLRELLEADIKEDDSNSTEAVKMLYRSCMNTDTIERRGEVPLLTLLSELGGWPVLEGDKWNSSAFDWVDLIGRLRLFNNDILLSLWVGPDGKNSDQYIVQFDQSDLVLPSSEYYHQGIDHAIMKAYKEILTNVAVLLGAERATAEKDMHDVIAFEIDLAKIMTPPHERRNFSQIYEKLPLSRLVKTVPDFNFTKYLSIVLPGEQNVPKIDLKDDVVIYASKYLRKLTAIVNTMDKRILANYILMRFIRHRINNLDKRFEKIQNELYRLLYGREEMPARWKFCIAYVNGNLGMSVGSLFVHKYFDGQSKQDMLYLTQKIQDQFSSLLTEVEWLSSDTKDTAREKLAAMIHNIGYPDLVLNDSLLHAEIEGLNYSDNEFFENVLKNLRGRTIREMSMLGQMVNRSIWTTTPAVVNAYYSRNRNQIMFPAGILQPPFYHKYFPKAMNFGGIGVVIGHEITHGFDDKGKQFDEQGNINQWWDMSSSSSFRAKAQCIINQYSQFRVPEVGVNLNGLNTQGENIADNGGIKQAYRAYTSWRLEHGEEWSPPLPGLPHIEAEKLFFLNFAQVWCGTARPEALKSKLKTAVHAPGKYRVLGTLANSDEFATVFKCPKGSKMNPHEKCKVW